MLKASTFALAKQTDPRSQEPARDNSAKTGKDEFPKKERAQPIGNCATHNGIANHDTEKVESADEQKPGEAARILPNEATMRADCIAQAFIMQSQ